MTIEPPWLQHYENGVPHEIDLSEFNSIVEILDGSVAKYADRPAFSNMGRTITYRELDEYSASLAGYLAGKLKLQRGDRIALMLPNVLQYPIAIFAALRAGLTVVNTNPLYTARELKHQLKDSGARAIIVMENFASTVAAVVEDTHVEHVIITQLGDMLGFPKSLITNLVVRHVKKLIPKWEMNHTTQFSDALKQGRRYKLADQALTHDDLAFLQYTGGTTGVSKGAMLTHGNLVANTLQSSVWLEPSVDQSQQVSIVTALPLYHIFALTANCLVFMKYGGHNHLITNPRDMEGFVEIIKDLKFNAITGVNTLFNGLLNTPGFESVDFSEMNLTLGGGMAVQRSVAEEWKRVTGTTLIEAYGLTETSPAVCINPMDLAEYNGCIGVPISSTHVDVRDEDGKSVGFDEPGELCIKGPQVMRGYWQRDEETAKVMTEDGFLKTGDIAVMYAGGFCKIVDRKKDMILVSGFNVYPNEIEEVVAAHPGVLEVAAVGLPDEKSGEIVKICVVCKDPNLNEKDLKAYCKQELTGYKVPRVIVFMDELPKTNVGKILRRELRDQT